MNVTIYQGRDQHTFAAVYSDSRQKEEIILETVADFTDVSIERILGTNRSRVVAWPRHLAMALIRRLTTLSLVEIGQFFGGRDHGTVIHACKRVARECDLAGAYPGQFQKLYKQLSETLK